MKTNILSLDLGRGSLGIAISRSGMFITPLPNLRFHMDDYDECLDLLLKAVEYEKIEHIIIGYPTYPSGDPCLMTPIVDEFIKKLETKFNVDIVKVDERNSTVEASMMLHSNNKKAKKQKSCIDSAAAMIILERYLKQIGQY